MSQTREIVTFQFGNYANYIGAHWWNIQESSFNFEATDDLGDINHDVLFREGTNYNRQTTFTPRLLLVDLDGSLKHLPREGELYGNSLKREEQQLPGNAAAGITAVEKLKEDLLWQQEVGEVELLQSETLKKNDFQKDLDNPEVDIHKKDYKLADNVESWTDYLYTRFHPRTVNVVHDYKHATDKQTFATFPNGVQVWRSEMFSEDFCDRIRQYVEECDYLQGFQTIFDCSNGFGGLATQCLQHLNDEYAKANFVLPIYQPQNVLFENTDAAMTDSIRVVNSALCYQQLIEQSSLFVPLSTQQHVWRSLSGARQIPALNYQADNLYQTSAILAAYLETISLRYRLKNAPSTNTLAGLCGDMSNYGRRMAAAALALPFTMQHDVDLIDCLDKLEGDLFTQLTPNCKIGSDYVIQTLCVRGIPLDRLKRPLEQAQQQMRMSAYKCSSVSEMFQLYLQCANHASLAHVASIPSPMPTRVPFPCEMFDANVNEKGFLAATQATAVARKTVNSVPTLAALQSSVDLAETLERLHREAKRIKIAKLHRFTQAGLEPGDYDEALEQLMLFKDNYEDNYEL